MRYEDIQQKLISLNIGEEAVSCRRHLHRHPETGRKEFETMSYLSGLLREHGIEHTAGVADTGITAVIRGAHPGPVIGLRADIDALPIREENPDLDYASQNEGAMHACGHDSHTSILLGTGIFLHAMREELHGTVKLFFQPDEEGDGGAERMIAAGCLEDPHVDYMLGLHVEPELPTGKIGIRFGKMYAASDMINVIFEGSSSHGASPEQGVDAILMAAQFLTNVQSAVSRNVAAVDSAVVSFGTIHGGNVRNQVADHVELTGIIRTLAPETRLLMRERVRTICEETARMMGGRGELVLMPGYKPLINDDFMVQLVKDNAVRLLGSDHVIEETVPTLGVEDFAYFAAERPACFFHLGCRDEAVPFAPLHSCHFHLNEACIPIGITLQAANVLKLTGDLS